jgi:Flp pilus assembly protein TadG
MTIPYLRRMGADQLGAAVVELALIAPMLALLTIGVVDMSNAYGRKLALEQGAQRAIDKIMQTTGANTVEDTLKTEAVCQVNGMKADGTCRSTPITTSNVTITYTLECTDGSNTTTTQSSTASATFDAFICPGGTVSQGRYIEVSITDKYAPMFPVHFAGFNKVDGTYHLSAAAGMRTE